MALTTSIGIITDVHDYLNRPSDERLKIFTETITDINHAHAISASEHRHNFIQKVRNF